MDAEALSPLRSESQTSGKTPARVEPCAEDPQRSVHRTRRIADLLFSISGAVQAGAEIV
jgi:hypothetical protein